MPRKRLTGPSEADRRLRRVDNFENRRLVQEQIEEFGVKQTAQLAANRAERRRIEITSTMMGDDGTRSWLSAFGDVHGVPAGKEARC
jgi:hypothetical protein